MLLANLVDKSMVQVVDEHVPRYRLLETFREYGQDHLDARGTPTPYEPDTPAGTSTSLNNAPAP